MKRLWPELLVLILFLVGDIFFEGLDSAAAAAGAGLLAFLVLLVTGKKRPGLLAEGAFFAIVTVLGELVPFPGGTLVLMEFCIGALLLLSTLFRWGLIERMSMGMIPSSHARVLTPMMGGVFTLHSVSFSGLVLAGHGSAVSGVLLFAVFYVLGLRLSASRMRKAEEVSGPRLTGRDDGTFLLCAGTLETGTMHLFEGDVAVVENVILISDGDRFLKTLEEFLRKKGSRVLSISSWPGDEIDLEIRGYVQTGSSWRKRL